MSEIQQLNFNEESHKEKYVLLSAINKQKISKQIFNRTKKKYLNYLFVILIIIGLLLYKSTLRSACNSTQANCLIQLDSSLFYLLGFYMVISVIILEISLLLIMAKYLYYIHLFYIIPTYAYIVHFHDTGGDLIHHGAYNKIIFYFLIIFIGIILSILYLLFTLYTKNYKIIFWSIISFFYFVSYLLDIKFRMDV
jgi:hypothetical protein